MNAPKSKTCLIYRLDTQITEMVLASQVGRTRCVYSCISQGSLDHPCITRCHDILVIGILEKEYKTKHPHSRKNMKKKHDLDLCLILGHTEVPGMVWVSQVGCTRYVYSCISQGSLDHPCITRCHDILIIGIQREKDETKQNNSS